MSQHRNNPQQVRVDVLAHDKGPGWASVVLVGSSAPVGLLASEIRLSLQRNQDGRFLAQGSDWSASEFWHKPLDVSVNDSGIALLLGPQWVDALLADPRTVCRIQVELPDQSFSGVLRMGRGIYPSVAAGTSPHLARETPPAPIEEPPAPNPAPEPATPPVPIVQSVPEPPPRRKRLFLVLSLLGLIALAALAWALYAGWLAPGQFVQPSGQAQTPPSVVVEPCSSQAMRDQADDLAFLQACVQSKPDTQTVLAVVQAGQEAKRCDLVQRLYAHQGQAGNADVAVAYAREFDPETFKGGCFAQPDRETALYWYETALNSQPSLASVAERVKQLKSELEKKP